MPASQISPPPKKDSDTFDDWLFKFWTLLRSGASGVWSALGITGTVSTVAAFDSSGNPTNLTESGTGNVAMTTSPVFTTPNIGVASGTSLAAAGLIQSSTKSGGVGYSNGAGGTANQVTSKATSVGLNAMCGTITMHPAALAADTTVAFTFTDTAIAANDLFLIVHSSVGTLGAYTFAVTPAAGSAVISVHNCTPGSLSEGIILRFAVIKAVVA